MTPVAQEEIAVMEAGTRSVILRPAPEGPRLDVSIPVSAPSRTRTRVDVGVGLRRGALAMGIVIVSFFTSTLVGNVMLEVARRDGINTNARVETMARSEQAIQDRLRQIGTPERLHVWASKRGLLAPDELAAASVPRP